MGIKLILGFVRAKWPFLAGILVLVGIVLTIRYFWKRPEQWNGAAEHYKTHASKLSIDSTRWHRDSLGLLVVIDKKDSIIAKQDTTIRLLSGELKEAQRYASEYESLYKNQVAESDATIDRLTDKESELAYYKALLKNGTLSTVGDITKLTPNEPSVVKAGLKTAAREEVATNTLSAVQVSLGAYRAQNERFGKGLRLASSGLATLSQNAKASIKGGIWPLNAKRRKQAKRFAASADSLNWKVQKVTELEDILNAQQ